MAEKDKKIIALIACAGSGARAGLPFNKLLYKVEGKAIAEYALDNFAEAKKLGIITDIIILCSETDKAEFEKIAARYGHGDHTHAETAPSAVQSVKGMVPMAVVTGGKARAQSVKNGLFYIKKNYASSLKDVIVLVCDGARPNCSADIIKRCVESALFYGSGTAAVPVSDTVKTAENGVVSSTPDRKNLYSAQTPQAFGFNALYEAYERAGADADGLTDDSAVMERFGKAEIRLVNGSYDNYKITAMEDIRRFETEKTAGMKKAGRPRSQSGALSPFQPPFPAENEKARNMDICGGGNMRVGAGSDTHRLITGRKLVLGGVTIPHHAGLLGHSDADALMHSVMDALLSAANLRDIGFHFPDTEQSFKDADSMELLKKTAELLKKKHTGVVNISAVIHAEKPKMSPYIPQMAENIAGALGIDKERVSISAKTGEGMGIVGEEKAIVCEAVCLISYLV